MSDNGSAVLATWLHAHGEDALYDSLNSIASAAASAADALSSPSSAVVTPLAVTLLGPFDFMS
jgi:hypothetical protein